MTRQTSSAPWADGPIPLITTPATYLDINSHSAVYCATEMAHSHNCLFRGLNAILLQAPHIKPSDQPGYNEQHVRDLLFYVESWTKVVDHHHHTEETCLFPEIEALAGEPGLLSGAIEQHEEFHGGLMKLKEYVVRMQVRPEEYRWENLKEIIDGFAPSFTRHLNDEVETLLSFKRLDSAGLRKCMDNAERVAKARGKIGYLYDIFPVVLGTCDKTFEGGNDFPPLPSLMNYAIKYWFSTGQHSGAWRFNPCDFWSMPRPLQMLPKNHMGETS